MNRKPSKYFYFLARVLSSPFFFLMMLMFAILVTFWATWAFLRYGGEVITYRSGQKQRIKDIYELLEKQLDK